ERNSRSRRTGDGHRGAAGGDGPRYGDGADETRQRPGSEIRANVVGEETLETSVGHGCAVPHLEFGTAQPCPTPMKPRSSNPDNLQRAIAETGAVIKYRFPWWLRPFLLRGVAGITLGRRIYIEGANPESIL